MTAHDHKVPTPGCSRCELNEDEMNPTFNVSEPYAPTMDDLRDLWLEHMINSSPGVRGVALALLAQAQFDQAITEHDRQVAEAARRDALEDAINALLTIRALIGGTE